MADRPVLDLHPTPRRPILPGKECAGLRCSLRSSTSLKSFCYPISHYFLSLFAFLASPEQPPGRGRPHPRHGQHGVAVRLELPTDPLLLQKVWGAGWDPCCSLLMPLLPRCRCLPAPIPLPFKLREEWQLGAREDWRFTEMQRQTGPFVQGMRKGRDGEGETLIASRYVGPRLWPWLSFFAAYLSQVRGRPSHLVPPVSRQPTLLSLHLPPST